MKKRYSIVRFNYWKFHYYRTIFSNSYFLLRIRKLFEKIGIIKPKYKYIIGGVKDNSNWTKQDAFHYNTPTGFNYTYKERDDIYGN